LHPAEIEKNLEFLGMEWAVSLLFGRPRLNTAAGNRRSVAASGAAGFELAAGSKAELSG